MAEAVDDVEKSLPEGVRDVWTRWTIAHIDDYACATDVYGLKVESRARIFSEPSELGVERLLSRYSLPVDAEVTYGVDDALEVVPSCFSKRWRRR